MLSTLLSPAPELVLFIVIVAATPGPLNLALLSFGLAGRRPFGFGVVLGAAFSYGGLYALTSSTARQVAGMNPTLFAAIQFAAAGMLLWLAWRIATARPSGRGIEGTTETAAVRQVAVGATTGVVIVSVGMKSWSSALAAGVLFCDGALTPAQHAVQFGLLAASMVLLFCTPWLVAGLTLGRWLTSPRALRSVNLLSGGALASLAVLMVAS